MTHTESDPGGDVVYRGWHRKTGEAVVTLEPPDGETLGLLPHIVRHSPTGLYWGYLGSGAADLARSLLADALGSYAACPSCSESGREPVEALADKTEESATVWCRRCDGSGITHLPYQAFEFDMVASLPRRGRTLTRADVRAWLTDHHSAGEWTLTHSEVRAWLTRRQHGRRTEP